MNLYSLGPERYLLRLEYIQNNVCAQGTYKLKRFDVSSALGQSSKRVGEMSGTMEECNMTIQNTSAMHREWILQGAYQLSCSEWLADKLTNVSI